jgi:hypothetical protein
MLENQTKKGTKDRDHTYSYWSIHALHVAFLHQDLQSLLTQVLHILLSKRLASL